MPQRGQFLRFRERRHAPLSSPRRILDEHAPVAINCVPVFIRLPPLWLAPAFSGANGWLLRESSVKLSQLLSCIPDRLLVVGRRFHFAFSIEMN